MPSRRALRTIRFHGRRVPATVVGVRDGEAIVHLREEDVVCAAPAAGRVPAAPAREVVVRWHPDHPGLAVLDEAGADPWLLAGTTAAATVLDSDELGLGVWRHRLDVRPAASPSQERRALTVGQAADGSTHEVLWDAERPEALLGAAVQRVVAARRALLAAEGVRAPALVVAVTDTRRRMPDGRPELVVVCEVRPSGGETPFRIAVRGSWQSAKTIGQPATALFHPRARHLHVLTFVD